jgi:hypothetical protein
MVKVLAGPAGPIAPTAMILSGTKSKVTGLRLKFNTTDALIWSHPAQ